MITRRDEFLEQINKNINNHGYHMTQVSASAFPSYSYTIGLLPKLGYELVLAGAAYFQGDNRQKLINFAANQLLKSNNLTKLYGFEGASFQLRSVSASWTRAALLGVFDIFGNDDIQCFQIVPTSSSWTCDTPDMSGSFNTEIPSSWRYLQEKWEHKIPKESFCVTSLNILQGSKVTELMRWEDDQWEMFDQAGDSIPKSQIRTVPLYVMIEADPSLSDAMDLAPGKGLWRESSDHSWKNWEVAIS